jgi:hypothetical protein
MCIIGISALGLCGLYFAAPPRNISRTVLCRPLFSGMYGWGTEDARAKCSAIRQLAPTDLPFQPPTIQSGVLDASTMHAKIAPSARPTIKPRHLCVARPPAAYSTASGGRVPNSDTICSVISLGVLVESLTKENLSEWLI